MQPHSMTDSYMVCCRIDIRYRECSNATVVKERSTHVSCLALRSPVSGVASPMLHPCRRRRAFPLRVAIKSHGYACMPQMVMNQFGVDTTSQERGGARVPEVE